jgi:hypothetical protein
MRAESAVQMERPLKSPFISDDFDGVMSNSGGLLFFFLFKMEKPQVNSDWMKRQYDEFSDSGRRGFNDYNPSRMKNASWERSMTSGIPNCYQVLMNVTQVGIRKWRNQRPPFRLPVFDENRTLISIMFLAAFDRNYLFLNMPTGESFSFALSSAGLNPELAHFKNTQKS